MTRLLFEWVVTASFLILAVIALRALLGRRISAGLRYALWTVVLVRLLVPLQFFSLPVPGILPEMEGEVVATNASPAAADPALQGELMGVPAMAAPQPSGVVVNYDANVAPSAVSLNVTRLWDVLGWLWLAGAMVMAAAFLCSNLTFALRLRRVRVPLEGADCPLPVYLAENLPSPCLFGLVWPSVYVTAENIQDPAMLRHILAHEYTHFHHGEHVWNLLRSAALAAHWWNPLVWLASILSRRDCELACDEGALKRLGDHERIAYGRTLLALITVKPKPGDLLRCATTMTSGQKSVFDRVARIARAPRRWLWAAVVAVIATALACVCAFGQAADPGPVDTPDLTADLTFSLGEDSPSVRIEGSVDGIDLDHTLWVAPSWFEAYEEESLRYPLGQLWFEMPLCGKASVQLDACWTDESRTIVKVTATPTALISSYFPAGNLIFTVDVSKGALLELDGYIPKLSPNAPELVPTEAEAVWAARIAAKLLEDAEEFYHHPAASVNSHAFDGPSLPATYSLNEPGDNVFLNGLDCGGAVWGARLTGVMDSRLGLPEEGELGYLSIESPRFLGGYFADAYGPAIVLYYPEENGPLLAVCFDDYTGGDYDPVSGFRDYDHGFMFFTVDLASGEVKHREISGYSGQAPDLSDTEMVESARLLAQLIQGAADYYEDTANPPPTLPFSRTMWLWFDSSGPGGWSTAVNLNPDGTFVGVYDDIDMGSTGRDYPMGTEYYCWFHGRFGDIRQASAGSWSMTLEELTLDTEHPVGEAWIEEGKRRISSAPYGLDGEDGQALEPGVQFVFYTPEASGKPGGELYGMENESSELYEFWTLWPRRYAISEGEGGTLGCYALRNMETGRVFFDRESWRFVMEQYSAP